MAPISRMISSSTAYDPPSHKGTVLPRGWMRWALLVGFWTLVALIYVTLGTLLHLTVELDPPATGGQTFEFDRALWTLLAWYTWIPSTLIVLWLVQRFPINRRRLVPNVFVHVIAAPAVSLFASLLYTGMQSVPMLFGAETVGTWFSDTLLGTFASSVRLDSFIYLTILAGVHALAYYGKFRERELHASRLEAELAEARLHALRLQLHPHFLFNTFHTISMLVRQEHGEEAVNTIAALGDFLRYVLDNTGTQEASMEQELDFLKSYLAIEQVRFKDRLDVKIDVTPDALPAQVPNLILQPLVENALRHGIEPTGGSGRVEVVARREGNRLRIRVQDDGAGVPDDWQLGTQQGLGLSNTKARLERLYNDNHRLTLSNAPDGGLMVTVVIPYRTTAAAPQPASANAA